MRPRLASLLALPALVAACGGAQRSQGQCRIRYVARDAPRSAPAPVVSPQASPDAPAPPPPPAAAPREDIVRQTAVTTASVESADSDREESAPPRDCEVEVPVAAQPEAPRPVASQPATPQPTAPQGDDPVGAQEAVLARNRETLAASTSDCRAVCMAAGNICTAAAEICRLTGAAHARCARAQSQCGDAGRARDGRCPVCPPAR